MNLIAAVGGGDDDDDVSSRPFPFAFGLEMGLEAPDLAVLPDLAVVLVVVIRALAVMGTAGLILALEEDANGGARTLPPHSESDSDSDSVRFRLEGDIC